MPTLEPEPAAAVSTLAPAGVEAERIATMLWWLGGAATLVWLAVVALALYAAYGREVRSLKRAPLRVVVIGGLIVPTVALTALLVYGLGAMAALRTPLAEPAVRVTAERWWWRVEYLMPDGAVVALANELRLPLNTRTEIRLTSPDVIHAFWVPSLAGKVDMIPGRETRIVLEPTKPGVYGGLCAEYCGVAHAQMAFAVEVLPPDEYAQWLALQSQPAAQPDNDNAHAGATLFRQQGCGGCHTVRGTAAGGVIGPDLTHFASRHTLGAAMLKQDDATLRAWIRHTGALKPGVLMPAYEALSDDELLQLTAYLRSLR